MRLAEHNPTSANFLKGINARLVDLEDVFRKQMFVHPGFRGRTSLKAVLPVLAPDLSYKVLAIQEGATASTIWDQIVTGELDAETGQAKRRDLLKYCELDTGAMVEIYKVLVEVTGVGAHAAS